MSKIRAFVALFLIGAVACSDPKPIPVKSVKKDNLLIGEWMIAGTGESQSNGRILWGQCNACPFIKFTIDYKGVIKSPDGLIAPFQWAVQNDKLTIKRSLASKTGRLIIGEGVYSMHLSKNKAYRIITLLNTKNHSAYSLNGPNSNSEYIDAESINDD